MMDPTGQQRAELLVFSLVGAALTAAGIALGAAAL